MKNLNDLLGKYVTFREGGEKQFGRVVSVVHGIANIKGIEQKTKTRPAYHIDVQELRVCSHAQVFELGKMFGDLD